MDKENLLEIDNLFVSVDDREILHGLNLAVKRQDLL
jgi:Fe-S cluster assembly ATPase SufC